MAIAIDRLHDAYSGLWKWYPFGWHKSYRKRPRFDFCVIHRTAIGFEIRVSCGNEAHLITVCNTTTRIYELLNSTVWCEINYPFTNFHSATVQVWEWISNFIPQFTVYVITYPCWNCSLSLLVKGAPGGQTCVSGMISHYVPNNT